MLLLLRHQHKLLSQPHRKCRIFSDSWVRSFRRGNCAPIPPSCCHFTYSLASFLIFTLPSSPIEPFDVISHAFAVDQQVTRSVPVPAPPPAAEAPRPQSKIKDIILELVVQIISIGDSGQMEEIGDLLIRLGTLLRQGSLSNQPLGQQGMCTASYPSCGEVAFLPLAASATQDTCIQLSLFAMHKPSTRSLFKQCNLTYTHLPSSFPHCFHHAW